MAMTAPEPAPETKVFMVENGVAKNEEDLPLSADDTTHQIGVGTSVRPSVLQNAADD